MGKHTISDLYQMQGMSLNDKVKMTKRRIQEWVDEYGEDGVYVSFSGGKDSTVLLTLAREMYGDGLKGAFVDTGLEYPEIRSFVRTFSNIDWIKPKMNFRQVIAKYGYPFISKEVSECVYGARKYLTSLLEMANAPDRQTDRQTDLPYRYWYERVTGTGAYQKPQRRKTPSVSVQNAEDTWNSRTGMQHKECQRGGYDNKYRKLRGIAEYHREQTKGRGSASETRKTDGDADRGRSDKGECP